MALHDYPAPVVAYMAATDAIQNNGAIAIPSFAPIAASSNGDNTIVAGVAGQRIRVVSFWFVVAANVTVTWKSSIAGAISGSMPYAANGGIAPPYCPIGLLQTALGEDLVMNLSAPVAVGGSLTYILVTP